MSDEMKRWRDVPIRCPHRNAIQYCPLYVASHSPKGNGCEIGRADEGLCAIDTGQRDYLASCRRMQRQEPELFAAVIAGGLAHRLGADRIKH